MNKFILSIIILSVSGFATASDRFIRIATPGENDSIDFTRPIPVSGSSKGLFEGNVLLGATGQTALELGRKVLAVREAIQNPGMPNAMQAVTDLGHDQRYYVMVRGWLSYQLQGDMSILDANREQTRDEVRARINFLEKAIRAIDLE